MRKIKKILSILLSCLMLMSLLSVGVFAAEGDQANPINANDKWFGYGVDCFLLNTTLEENDTDGVWYQLTADAAGILHVEHSSTEVDYQLTVTVNGQEYLGYENGVYNKPVITLPVAVGDVITIHVIARDTTMSGTVYCNAKFIDGSNDINQMIKLKGANVKVWIANGATLYLQDDSLQGEYAAAGLKLQSSVEGKGVTVISASKNYTDTDGDGYVELKLGGSAGSAGVPAVKPSFAIENQSGQDAWFVLNVVEDTAHECVYTNEADVDCNTCGAVREAKYDVQTYGGASTSEDVNGLAFRFDVTNANLVKVADTAYAVDYANSTVTPTSAGTYKLVTMGAIVSNNNSETNLEDVARNDRLLNIVAENAFGLDEGTPYFCIRIVDIPDDQKDTVITARPYFIYENENGEQITVYGDEQAATYNGAI